MLIALALVIIVGLGLYLWHKQHKKISEISSELNEMRHETAISRKENHEALTKINNTLLARSGSVKPPRLIGHLISASAVI